MLLLFRLQSKGEGVPKRSTAKKKNEKKRKNRPHGVCGRELSLNDFLHHVFYVYQSKMRYARTPYHMRIDGLEQIVVGFMLLVKKREFALSTLHISSNQE